MNGLDYVILLVYFVVLLGIGWRASSQQKNAMQYFVGGKKSNTFAIMTLWMASWVGGATIIGTTEQAFNKGLYSLLYPGAVAIGCVLFAITFARRVKASGDTHGHITYPDFIEAKYGSRCRIIATITAIIGNVGYTSSQLLATAIIMNQLTDLSLGTSFIVSTVVTVAYTAVGGYFAMDATSRFQAVLIFVGICCVGMPLTLFNVGDMGRFTSELPEGFLGFGTLGFWSVLGMFVSSLMTFYTSSDSYIRCYSAKSQISAFRGTMLASILVLSIGVSVTIMGLGARILFPDLENGANAFITIMVRLFPDGVKGLMLVALLSAIMSTACACILSASANISHDIYHRFINPNTSDKKIVILSMLSSGTVGVVSALVAWHVRDIIGLLFIAFTINSACLFVPTISAYFWKRGTGTAAFYSISLALITVLSWYFCKNFFPHINVFTIDPVWPGLAVSVVVFFFISLATKQETA